MKRSSLGLTVWSCLQVEHFGSFLSASLSRVTSTAIFQSSQQCLQSLKRRGLLDESCGRVLGSFSKPWFPWLSWSFFFLRDWRAHGEDAWCVHGEWMMADPSWNYHQATIVVIPIIIKLLLEVIYEDWTTTTSLVNIPIGIDSIWYNNLILSQIL